MSQQLREAMMTGVMDYNNNQKPAVTSCDKMPGYDQHIFANFDETYPGQNSWLKFFRLKGVNSGQK